MMEKLKILRGNSFTVVIAVKAYRADGSEVEDFDLGSCSGVSVKMGVNALKSVDYVVDGNNISISFSGSEGLGWYQMEVTGTLDGEKWRFDNERMLQIVEHSSAVSIPEDSILAEDSYTIEGNVQLLQAASSGEGVQSDWEETNSASLAFIKNKPDLSSFATQAWVTAKGYATQVWVAAQGFATQAWITAQGFYKKAASGIPKSDLASDVQASLGKADSALQSFTETDPTVPSWAKQSTKPTYTASEVGALPADTPIPVVPTNVSAFTNDAGYLTAHQDVSGKEDKVDIVSASGATLTAEVGKYYTLSSVGTLAITLPTIASGTTKVQTVSFYISAGSSPAVTFTSTHSIYYSDGFEIAASSTYEVSAAYNGIAWVVASVKIVIPT